MSAGVPWPRGGEARETGRIPVWSVLRLVLPWKRETQPGHSAPGLGDSASAGPPRPRSQAAGAVGAMAPPRRAEPVSSRPWRSWWSGEPSPARGGGCRGRGHSRAGRLLLERAHLTSGGVVILPRGAGRLLTKAKEKNKLPRLEVSAGGDRSVRSGLRGVHRSLPGGPNTCPASRRGRPRAQGQSEEQACVAPDAGGHAGRGPRRRSGRAPRASPCSWHGARSQPHPVSRLGSVALGDSHPAPSRRKALWAAAPPGTSPLNLPGEWGPARRGRWTESGNARRGPGARAAAQGHSRRKAGAGSGSRPRPCPQSRVPPLPVSTPGLQPLRDRQGRPATRRPGAAPAGLSLSALTMQSAFSPTELTCPPNSGSSRGA